MKNLFSKLFGFVAMVFAVLFVSASSVSAATIPLRVAAVAPANIYQGQSFVQSIGIVNTQAYYNPVVLSFRRLIYFPSNTISGSTKISVTNGSLSAPVVTPEGATYTWSGSLKNGTASVAKFNLTASSTSTGSGMLMMNISDAANYFSPMAYFTNLMPTIVN